MWKLIRDVTFFPESMQNFMLQIERFNKDKFLVKVEFVPTVPHCSLATLIGLCIRQKLQKCLPYSCKLDISIAPGTHNIEDDGKSGICFIALVRVEKFATTDY